MPSLSFGLDLRAEEDLAGLCQEPVIEPGPSLVLPGTFRWIVDAECARELLVVDAYLMPRKFVQWAKSACKHFVFPDKGQTSIDELMQSIEDDWIWEEGNWPHHELAGALSGRVPAGCYRDVWAVAENGNKIQRQRTLAMALMIASALLRPLQAADTNANKEPGHDKFQRLVDEASGELWRARGEFL